MRYEIGLLGPNTVKNQSWFCQNSASFVRRVVGKDHVSEYMGLTVLAGSY